MGGAGRELAREGVLVACGDRHVPAHGCGGLDPHVGASIGCLERLRDAAIVSGREALGDGPFESAYAEGASLSLDDAIDYARRQRSVRASATVGWDALTPTEAKVAALVAEGSTDAQVATQLLMGPETVKTHLSRVFAKVGVANRKELILATSRRGGQ